MTPKMNTEKKKEEEGKKGGMGRGMETHSRQKTQWHQNIRLSTVHFYKNKEIIIKEPASVEEGVRLPTPESTMQNPTTYLVSRAEGRQASACGSRHPAHGRPR